MHSGWGFGSGAKVCGKCSSVARVFFFYSGNLAKVNRMSTAHMQGEHLIKGTHTRRKKHTERSCCGGGPAREVLLAVRNTCDTWPRPSVKFTRQSTRLYCAAVLPGFSSSEKSELGIVLEIVHLYLNHIHIHTCRPNPLRTNWRLILQVGQAKNFALAATCFVRLCHPHHPSAGNIGYRCHLYKSASPEQTAPPFATCHTMKESALRESVPLATRFNVGESATSLPHWNGKAKMCGIGSASVFLVSVPPHALTQLNSHK